MLWAMPLVLAPGALLRQQTVLGGGRGVLELTVGPTPCVRPGYEGQSPLGRPQKEGFSEAAGRERDSALRVHTERRLQGMSCLGAPARRVDVWVVRINPEVVAVAPAVKVELGGEAVGSGVPRGASSAVRASPPLGPVEARSQAGGTQGQPHHIWSWPEFTKGLAHHMTSTESGTISP